MVLLSSFGRAELIPLAKQALLAGRSSEDLSLVYRYWWLICLIRFHERHSDTINTYSPSWVMVAVSLVTVFDACYIQ